MKNGNGTTAIKDEIVNFAEKSKKGIQNSINNTQKEDWNLDRVTGLVSSIVAISSFGIALAQGIRRKQWGWIATAVLPIVIHQAVNRGFIKQNSLLDSIGKLGRNFSPFKALKV